jgi:N-acetylmuramoyl-L-alanine amidase
MPLGLFERAFRANAMKADLFIALHHDSVPDYLLQTWQFDGKEEHFNDSFAGYAIFISNGNADRGGSLKFGQFLGAALQARGLGYTPHYTFALMQNRRRELLDPDTGVYRYDQLVVLKETHMPAVLLEAGSIVNRGEELALASPERRALESTAITAAVENFCAARASRPSERLVKRALEPRRTNATRAAR